jgi:uncharacterized membrane protein
MEALMVLLFLAMGVCLFVLPIVALIKSRSTQEQLRRLQAEHDLLLAQLNQLRRVVESSTPSTSEHSASTVPSATAPRATSTAASASSLPTAANTGPSAGSSPLSPPTPTTPPPPRPAVPAPQPADIVGGRPTQTPPPLPKSLGPTASPPPPLIRPAIPSAPAFNWERFVGTKLIAWLGGLVLFLAAAYFIKYSFDHAWIPREVQAALGFLLGIGLVIGGFALKKKAFATSAQTFCATGVLILYAVTFGCRAYYDFPLFTAPVTFALMTLITGSGFLLAVRMEARVVAILGMLGGFLTPVILNTGRDQALGLFVYIGLAKTGLGQAPASGSSACACLPRALDARAPDLADAVLGAGRDSGGGRAPRSLAALGGSGAPRNGLGWLDALPSPDRAGDDAGSDF